MLTLFRPALFVSSVALMVLAVLMLPCLLLALARESVTVGGWLLAHILTLLSGGLLWSSCRAPVAFVAPRQMFLITALSWLLASFYAALPLWLAVADMTWVDALFEAVSGITTTGSTVLTGLDAMSPDILLWRSLCQWLGGLGIIGMAILVLPFLRVGGMRLFRTESSDWSEKRLPRTANMLSRLIALYVGLSGLCIAAYILAGMSVFDAVNHAFATISTGGYSTSDASIGKFGPAAHWVCILFMVIGAMPFLLMLPARHWSPRLLWRDQQVRGLWWLLGLTSLLLAALLVGEGREPWEALTAALLNVTSVVTTTGFAGEDYERWGPFAVGAFALLTLAGGCSGSTSGGVKIFRYQLLLMLAREQVTRAVHPRAVVSYGYNGRPVSAEVLVSAVVFLLIVVASWSVLTLVLAATGLDLVTATSGAATALMNVGPGLGERIGPAGNFAGLSDTAKYALCLGMLLGRLEYLTILVLFTRRFWRG
ncbi:MAG TPA: TrkH family potassium uptake protein [Spongiibacteraceae bacterium]|nr:TrkH family potassium uptake protein [Spongiibacteraceae bacterium]